MPEKYYQNTNGIVLLFNIINQNEFTNVKKWLKDIKENTQKISVNKREDILIVYLIENKIDMTNDRFKTKEMAEK